MDGYNVVSHNCFGFLTKTDMTSLKNLFTQLLLTTAIYI